MARCADTELDRFFRDMLPHPRAESRGETAVITGDMMHHPCQIAHPEWSPAFDSDPEAARVTRRAMLKDWADQPVLVIGTHFATPTAGHVRRDGVSYRFDC